VDEHGRFRVLVKVGGQEIPDASLSQIADSRFGYTASKFW